MTALLSLQQAVQLMADYFFRAFCYRLNYAVFLIKGLFYLFIYLFDALLTEKNISDRYNSPQNRGKKNLQSKFFF